MTTEEEKLILDNMSLAYDMAWKYNKKFNGLIELDELKSLALFGLTKAAKTFDSSLGYNFSTYACTIIKNEILIYYRNNIKPVSIVSLSDKLTDDIEVQDMLASDTDIFEEIVNNTCIEKLHKEIATLSDRHKQIMYFRLKGYTMNQIGKELNLTQPQISRDYNKALDILRNRFKEWR